MSRLNAEGGYLKVAAPRHVSRSRPQASLFAQREYALFEGAQQLAVSHDRAVHRSPQCGVLLHRLVVLLPSRKRWISNQKNRPRLPRHRVQPDIVCRPLRRRHRPHKRALRPFVRRSAFAWFQILSLDHEHLWRSHLLLCRRNSKTCNENQSACCKPRKLLHIESLLLAVVDSSETTN